MVPNRDEDLMLYFFEKHRIQSFKSWPFNEKRVCNITRMAEAGFVWCGTMEENDAASCFLCRKTLDGWEQSDDPWMEHKKHAPQCQFVKLGRPEKELTVAEMLELLDVYVEKMRSDVSDKARKFVTDKLTESREKYKNL